MPDERNAIEVDIRSFASSAALWDGVVEHLSGISKATPSFLLLSSSVEANAWRRRLADKHPGLSFGRGISSFGKYVEERWSLFGDERALVDDSQRLMLAARAIQDRLGDAQGLQPTTGLVHTLVRVVREGFCHQGFRAASEKLAAAGEEMHVVIARYAELLGERGLIEYGEALFMLAETEMPLIDVVCIGIEHPLPAEAAYLQAVGARSLVLRPAGNPAQPGIPALVAHLYNAGAPLRFTKAVRFALASGPYAEAPLIARLAAEYINGGCPPEGLFIACPDPSSVFAHIAPLLAERGIGSTGRQRQSFAETLLGKTFFEARALMRASAGIAPLDRDEAIAYLSDYASGPFCRASREAAFRRDKDARGNRSLDLETMLRDLHEDERAFSASRKGGQQGDPGARGDMKYGSRDVAKAFAEGREADALSMLYQVGCKMKCLDALQLASAAETLEIGKKTIAALLDAGVEGELALGMLAEAEVSMVCSMPGAGAAAKGSVRFGTLDELASEGARIAFICQMTSEGFPLAAKGDPLNSLFARMGIERKDTLLADMRTSFKRSLDAVSDAVLLERALNEDDAVPMRASVLFEEAVDCFRADITSLDDIDEATGLPEDLLQAEVEGTLLCEAEGEDDLVALMPTPFGSPSYGHDARPLRRVADQTVFDLTPATARRISVMTGAQPQFSASQIESYMACPYKWFLLRKVKPEALDRQNDAAAYGTFAHAVLEGFYRRFTADGPRRVTVENKEEALTLFDEVFDEMRDHPTSDLADLIVLADEFDFREMEQWRRKLRAVIEIEDAFLPGFAPSAFEVSFGDEKGVEYAGHIFKGRIDRIDVNENGRAVIIDYKGGLKKGYTPVGKDGGGIAADHVQSLIYAQIAKRELGYDVQGTLYRSYKDNTVRGACSAAVGVGDGMKGDTLMAEDADAFRAWLDQTESAVEEAIERMLAGDIAPDPQGDDACDYCPAAETCAKRKEDDR